MSTKQIPGQLDRIVREYFGPDGAGECPICQDCGRDLEIRSKFLNGFGLQLDIGCPGCGTLSRWLQPQPIRDWKTLHLDYFAECYLLEQAIRCPYDDCYVTWAEFNDQVIQFNCPYCNRRGRIVVDRGAVDPRTAGGQATSTHLKRRRKDGD